MNHYEKGEQVRLKLTDLRDESGTPVDADTVRLRILPGRSSERDYTLAASEIAHDGLGAYSKLISLDVTGLWRYRWETTGPITAEEGHLFTETTVFV